MLTAAFCFLFWVAYASMLLAIRSLVKDTATIVSEKERLMTIEQLIDDLRDLLARYADLPEKDVYEALLRESDDWQMRLDELNEEARDGEE